MTRNPFNVSNNLKNTKKSSTKQVQYLNNARNVGVTMNSNRISYKKGDESTIKEQ